ncbi:MAG TPA: sigma-70 family RNA polymerase sigma factor [Phycisphaerae bacterium]|jgi:RNA polymerase sigma-70 factor (ECF subfamily)|nr:sigma-70 family RNA polymerase sigma factor [Phycisphaerae bacterium]
MSGTRVPLANEEHTARGDTPQRIAAAYDAHGAALFRYAAVICASASLAEDAVQQAFAKFAALGPRLPAVESPGDYLRTAVRNECYRLLQSPRPAALPDDPPLLAPVDAALRQEDDRRAVEGALAALPAEQREIVHLKVYENRTFQEIAALLEIPPNTAASRYRYALEKLRESLTPLRKSEE